MEEGEDHHLDTEEETWDSNFQIWIRDLGSWVDHFQSGRCEDADQEGLPKREEDNQLDGKHLEEGAVVGEVKSELDIKLDQTVHGDGHRGTLKDENLILLAEKPGEGERMHTHMCPNTGELEDSQYLPKYCVTTAVMVIATRMKQYW